MNLDRLCHLVQVLESLAPEGNVIVVGSSALLVPFPELGQPGCPLETSLDADALIEPLEEPEGPEMVMEAVGSSSRFQKRYGYHVDLMRPVLARVFPDGWRERLVAIPGSSRSHALEAYDVAVCKLRAGRQKDTDLLSGMIRDGLLDRTAIEERLRHTPMKEAEIVETHDRLAGL